MSDIVNKEKETDFYQILGLSQDATTDQIYEQYLRLSLKYHPDKGGDTEKYRLVNLAYKVLKDPENRSKYDNSLATTFNQFKDENRDTSYHVNEKFMKFDEDSKNQKSSVFDLEKFLQKFEETRTTTEGLDSINPENQDIDLDTKLDDLLTSRLADRDNDLYSFQNNQKTDMFNPANNPEEFNYIFNQYKSMQSTSVEEVLNFGYDDSNQVLSSAPLDNNIISPEQSHAQLEALTQQFHQDFAEKTCPVVTSEQGASEELINAGLELHKQQMKELSNPKNVEFINTIDDTNKCLF